MPEKTDPTTAPADDIEPDEADDEVEETEDDDEGEEPGGEPEWTPPTREQWEASQAKLKRAREQARKLRETGRSQTAPAAPADPAATEAARADVEKWQRRAVTSAAQSALVARGADPDMVELALGRLKVSEIEFDDDDQPELDDWLDEIQDKYPKLFAKPDAPVAPARPRAGKLEPGGKQPVRPRMSLGEQIIANSTGRRR